jgi:hypothetical protein
VNAHRAPAGRTLVLLGLLAYELVDAVVSDEYKVLNHAHVVFGSASSIQMPQILAGRTVTFRTVIHFAFLNGLAVLDLTSNNGSGLIDVCCPATEALVSCSQASHADPAVHSAWCNQASLHI